MASLPPSRPGCKPAGAGRCRLRVMIQVMAGQPAVRVEDVRRPVFEEIVRTEARRLFVVANGVLRDPDEAEDAVQETLLRAWRSWHQLRDEERRRAWLTRICINHCLRRREGLLRRWLPLPGDVERLEARPLDAADPDLDRACRRLSARQRAVITLHYRFGYSLDECAEMLGSRPGTVRSHLNRALTALRRELGDE